MMWRMCNSGVRMGRVATPLRRGRQPTTGLPQLGRLAFVYAAILSTILSTIPSNSDVCTCRVALQYLPRLVEIKELHQPLLKFINNVG